MKITKTLTILNKLGLHARAATKLVELASKYQSDIIISQDDQAAPANSVIALLMLGSGKGKQVTVECSGVDAENAMSEIENLIANKFDEGE
ncbi:HPr family phosphocarrier protein [Glaciecola petra]|uniref:HPr family phosphocarrier protein n=1 Tax=Glaciecola petra TaxID=3075602 RepID=A0ABU2ZWP6_9ALTE|nr:HPr family phosphocarrier protein [Aestuariibacter sp. P117]MDT0595999.1 HPr family phosphocarrier protein [Aestuariibacter sp. P117]